MIQIVEHEIEYLKVFQSRMKWSHGYHIIWQSCLVTDDGILKFYHVEKMKWLSFDETESLVLTHLRTFKE